MTAAHFPTDDLDPAEHEDYPHHLTVEEAQALADAYCIDNETMRVCKEEFDLAHDEWMAFRQVHSLRHAQPTIVDPSKSIEEAASYLTQRQRRQATERKAKRKHRRARDRAARQWWRLEETLAGVAKRFEDWHADYEPPQVHVRLGSTESLEPAALILPIHDLHYGKYASEAECGARYDRSIAEERAHAAVDAVLEQALRVGCIERIITVCGTSDYLHIDQDTPAATTSGTPQHTDGTMGDIIAGGQALAVQLIDKMRAVAPTEIIYCPGNHDFQASQWMHTYLQAYYRGTEDVTFSRSRRTRQYFEYGVTKGCFFHGDVRKGQLKELGNTIAREHGFGEYTMAISGHKHFRQADDRSGLLMHQCLSLSGSDLWHDKNLYTGLPGLQAFVLDKERGPISTPTWYV